MSDPVTPRVEGSPVTEAGRRVWAELKSAIEIGMAEPVVDANDILEIEREAITAWLQSPEAESRLAAALHKFPPYSDSTAFIEERARAILAALTKP